MLKKFTESMRERVQMFVAEMQAETGLSVVEMILILVVIIALVLIFKTQLSGRNAGRNRAVSRGDDIDIGRDHCARLDI